MLTRLKQSLSLIGLSAGLMYLFDPQLGKRRRSLLRDKVTLGRNTLLKATDVVVRDTGNRLFGLFCELRAMVLGRDTSDDVVAKRVRSKIGRYSSHAGAIEVHASDGHVTLRGPILAAEVSDLLDAVKSVDGVHEVESQLDIHASPEKLSALQGGARPTGEPTLWMQDSWSPSARFIAGTAGTVLMINCAAKGTLSAITLGTAGFVLFLRAVTNRPVGSLVETSYQNRDPRPTPKSSARPAHVPAVLDTPPTDIRRAPNLPAAIQDVHR